jgi:hypothetical protein
MAFPDHHRFGARDVARITKAARGVAAAIVLTTEKDAVRLAGQTMGDLPIASVPLILGVEPADRFRSWLLTRLSAAQHASRPSTEDGLRTPAPAHQSTDAPKQRRTQAPKHLA